MLFLGLILLLGFYSLSLRDVLEWDAIFYTLMIGIAVVPATKLSQLFLFAALIWMVIELPAAYARYRELPAERQRLQRLSTCKSNDAPVSVDIGAIQTVEQSVALPVPAESSSNARPSLAVVEVGQRPRICPGLTTVQELSTDLLPELDIVTAASPLPLSHIPSRANPPGLTLAMLKQNSSDLK